MHSYFFLKKVLSAKSTGISVGAAAQHCSAIRNKGNTVFISRRGGMLLGPLRTLGPSWDRPTGSSTSNCESPRDTCCIVQVLAGSRTTAVGPWTGGLGNSPEKEGVGCPESAAFRRRSPQRSKAGKSAKASPS